MGTHLEHTHLKWNIKYHQLKGHNPGSAFHIENMCTQISDYTSIGWLEVFLKLVQWGMFFKRHFCHIPKWMKLFFFVVSTLFICFKKELFSELFDLN